MDRPDQSFAYSCKYNCYLVLREDTCWFVVSLVKQHMEENPLTMMCITGSTSNFLYNGMLESLTFFVDIKH